MNNVSDYFSLALLVQGIVLAGMGLYFIFLRPPMLPEDLRYIKTESIVIDENVPGILIWLKKVFIVMGGYIFSTGLLISYMAITLGKNPTIRNLQLCFLPFHSLSC